MYSKVLLSPCWLRLLFVLSIDHSPRSWSPLWGLHLVEGKEFFVSFPYRPGVIASNRGIHLALHVLRNRYPRIFSGSTFKLAFDYLGAQTQAVSELLHFYTGPASEQVQITLDTKKPAHMLFDVPFQRNRSTGPTTVVTWTWKRWSLNTGLIILMSCSHPLWTLRKATRKSGGSWLSFW